MNTLARPSRFAALLTGIAVFGAASLASAAGKLDGTHNGSYTAKTDSPLVVGGTAPGSVTFTTLTRGNARMVIQGTDADKKPFMATFTFRSTGKVYTDAIIPGVASKKGQGTWSLSANGKVLTMNLTSTQEVAIKLVIFQKGHLTTQATVRVKGPHDKFLIRGAAAGTSNIGKVTGHYKFR